MKENSPAKPETKCRELRTQVALRLKYLPICMAVDLKVIKLELRLQAESTKASEARTSIDSAITRRVSSHSLTILTLRVSLPPPRRLMCLERQVVRQNLQVRYKRKLSQALTIHLIHRLIRMTLMKRLRRKEDKPRRQRLQLQLSLSKLPLPKLFNQKCNLLKYNQLNNQWVRLWTPCLIYSRVCLHKQLHNKPCLNSNLSSRLDSVLFNHSSSLHQQDLVLFNLSNLRPNSSNKLDLGLFNHKYLLNSSNSRWLICLVGWISTLNKSPNNPNPRLHLIHLPNNLLCSNHSNLLSFNPSIWINSLNPTNLLCSSHNNPSTHSDNNNPHNSSHSSPSFSNQWQRSRIRLVVCST